MRILPVVLVGLVLVGAARESAADQAKRPEEGGSRVLELFPQEGLQHLPQAMLEHGGPSAMAATGKDPRNDSASGAHGREDAE